MTWRDVESNVPILDSHPHNKTSGNTIPHGWVFSSFMVSKFRFWYNLFFAHVWIHAFFFQNIASTIQSDAIKLQRIGPISDFYLQKMNTKSETSPMDHVSWVGEPAWLSPERSIFPGIYLALQSQLKL